MILVVWVSGTTREPGQQRLERRLIGDWERRLKTGDAADATGKEIWNLLIGRLDDATTGEFVRGRLGAHTADSLQHFGWLVRSMRRLLARQKRFGSLAGKGAVVKALSRGQSVARTAERRERLQDSANLQAILF
jgi:hypothetical protein